MNIKPMEYTCDVLVIGGGYSGSWAAIRAAALGCRVLMADKGPSNWGGLGMMSGGDMIVMQPEFQVNDLLDDLVYYYDGLCDQNQIRTILEASYQRFLELESWGHVFARDESGKLLCVPQRDLPHMRYYVYHPYGKGGAHASALLTEKMREYGVRRISNVEITEILKDGDAACGAAGFHARSGARCIIRAKAVILCSHIGGWKESYLANTCAGEGAYLAFQAGATLRNMEFVSHWNVPVQFAWEGQTGLLPYGARFLNNKGEDFMRRYSPVHGAKADPHYNIRGMALETQAGNAPIWFDTSTMSEEGVRVMTPAGGWMKLNNDKLKSLGIDFFHMKTPWTPSGKISFGGVAADEHCMTGVPGLFVAGRALSVHAGVYMGGWDTCITSTTGYIAGEAAADLASRTAAPVAGSGPEPSDDMLSRLGRPGIAPKDIVRRMQEIMAHTDVSILKTGEGLSRALAEVEEVRDNVLPDMSASEPHYLLKAMEARSMTLLTEMYLRASLARRESRCGHYRQDHPERNRDICWIDIENAGGAIRTRQERLPLERYPVTPTRFYMDDFNYPK